ncbi:DNA repair protein RadC [Pseudomonadales bacterium]|nr:DNA repair protein RadC [Pseudomonadales bacterium]
MELITKRFPLLASTDLNAFEELTIQEAIKILDSRLKTHEVITNVSDVKRFCRLHIAQERDEHFCSLFLDSQHRMIAFERLFSGTIDSASIYPRVVVRRALELNAAAIIFTHNHPSGVTEPSQSDIAITKRLTDALSLIDVRVLDHMIAGMSGITSMAEKGLI